MSSATVNGKVLDYKFKPYSSDIPKMYQFFVGDIYLGIVCHRGNTNWNATVTIPNTFNDTVGGFDSRESACEFMLQVAKIEDFYTHKAKEKKEIEESIMADALIEVFEAYTNDEVRELHQSVRRAWTQGLLLKADRERDEDNQ